MKPLHLTLLLLLLPTQGAEDAPGRVLLSRMEPGSIIKDLLIPSYNQAKQLTSVLRADQLRVETEDLCQAENITLQLTAHHERRDLAPAVFVIQSCQFDLNNRSLRSESPVRAVSPHFFIQSQGLLTHVGTGRAVTAFFLPPVRGSLNPSPRFTAMNAPIRSLAGAALITCAVAQPRPIPSPEHLARLKSVIQSSTANDSSVSVDQQFRRADSRSEPATATLHQFIKEQSLTLQANSSEAEVQRVLKDDVMAASDMPAFQPQADSIGFSCQGGAFYDHNAAALIFLKNVNVRDATYALSAQGEIKVLFDAPAAKADSSEKKNDESSPLANGAGGLGHVAQIIASGGVKMEASDEKGLKNYAMGDQALYDAKTDDIILRGSRLIFQRGTESRFESNNPDAWLMFNKKTKSFSMSEGWTARLSMPK